MDLAGVGGDDEFDGVGVDVFPQVGGDEFVAESFFSGKLEGMAEPFVGGVQVQKPCQQGFVSSVAPVGGGEGAVEVHLCFPDVAADQLVSHFAQAGGSGGVGAGGADHDGTHDVEKRGGGHRTSFLRRSRVWIWALFL